MRKEFYRKRYKKRSKKPDKDIKINLVLYALLTHEKVSTGELTAFSGAVSDDSVHSMINTLRKKYKIQFKDEFYFYLGERKFEK